MEYFVGVGLALAISLLATLVGFDRDRALYPVMMIVIASYYGLFAIMGGSVQALTMESAVIAGFLFVSILGFKRNLWFVAGALFAHGSEIAGGGTVGRILRCPGGKLPARARAPAPAR